jgi:hypothetical protein
MRSKSRAAVLLLAGALAAPAAAREGAPKPPSFTLKFDAVPLVDCHFFLKTFGKGSARPGLDPNLNLGEEAELYKRAGTTIQDPMAWRWFEDQVVAGPDAKALRAAAAALPPSIDAPRTRSGIGMLVDAIQSAYPRFEAHYWPERQRGLVRSLVTIRRQYLQAESRIAPTLIEKGAFAPIDAPVTVYLTLKAGSVGSWGKVGGSYYTVIGTQGMSPLMLLETGLHEATHVIEAVQPFNSRAIFLRLRREIQTYPAEDVDVFLHGLTTYSAGILVKRFVEPSYVLAGVLAPAHREEYAPYLSTYGLVWNAYLDGKLDADKVVLKLAEEFRAVRKLEEEKAKQRPAAPPS